MSSSSSPLISSCSFLPFSSKISLYFSNSSSQSKWAPMPAVGTHAGGRHGRPGECGRPGLGGAGFPTGSCQETWRGVMKCRQEWKSGGKIFRTEGEPGRRCWSPSEVRRVSIQRQKPARRRRQEVILKTNQLGIVHRDQVNVVIQQTCGAHTTFQTLERGRQRGGRWTRPRPYGAKVFGETLCPELRKKETNVSCKH